MTAISDGIMPATPQHALMLDASGIRQADREEWVGGTGMRVLPALMAVLAMPVGQASTIMRAGVPLCMFGTHPTAADGVGQVWFLASKQAEKHVLSLHRALQPVLAEMHTEYPVLLAYTHPKNTLHHHWMERNGFVFSHLIVTAMGLTYLAYVRKAT